MACQGHAGQALSGMGHCLTCLLSHISAGCRRMSVSVQAVSLGIPELVTVVIAMTGINLALVKYIAKGFVARVDKIERDVRDINAEVRIVDHAVDELKQTSIPRDEFTATISALRREVQDGNAETHRRIESSTSMMLNAIRK